MACLRAPSMLLYLSSLVVLLLTTNYGPLFFVDGASAFHPAWHLAQHGHLWIDDGSLRVFAFVPGQDGHLYSNRPPGLILSAMPAYLFARWIDTPSGVPAAVVVCMFAAGAVVVMYRLLLRLVTPGLAMATAIVAGFGTSLWSVAAAEYFAHAITCFWVLLALLLLARGQNWLAGAALALAIATRPHLAVVALVFGVWGGAAARRIRPTLAVGIVSALGLACVMTYNAYIFGQFNVQGGYEEYVTGPLSGEPPGASGSHYYLNILGSLVSGPRGILVLTPVVLFLLPGMRGAWAASPWWPKAAAVSGFAYMIVQWQIQDGADGFLGGYNLYAYRYTLEWLLLSVPLLALAARHVLQHSPRVAPVLAVAGLFSLWIHGVGALLYSLDGSYPFHPWLAWSPVVTLVGSSVQEQLISVGLLLAGLLATYSVYRADPRRLLGMPDDVPLPRNLHNLSDRSKRRNLRKKSAASGGS